MPTVADSDVTSEIEKLRKEVEFLKTGRSRDKRMLKQYSHMCSQNEKRAKENIEIQQTMERYHKRTETRLTSKNEALTAERNSLKVELTVAVILKVERSGTKKQLQELKDRCAHLQEETAYSLPCTQPHNTSMLRPHEQGAAVALAMEESALEQTYGRSKLNGGRIGLATPTASREFENSFDFG
ncbi:hypothetical protein LPJ72_000540 [Coemansia sp. Benny D160-2]|nr:hypothetical protein LPJ72_000540 [Coemansia sp. Benny D160-2]